MHMIRLSTVALVAAATLATVSADAQKYYVREKLTKAAADASTAPPAGKTATAIVLRSAIGDCIQVAELEAIAGGRNVAAAANGGRASAQDIWSNESNASKANDGVKPAGYPDIYHSACRGDSYLRIDFAGPSDVQSVVAYGRGDGFQSRDTFTYELLNGSAIVAKGAIDARSGSGSSTPS